MTSAPPDDGAEPVASEPASARDMLGGLVARAGRNMLGIAPGGGEEAASGKAVQTLAALAIARLGTRSLRGAALVSAGLIAKALFDRSQQRRASGNPSGKRKA